MYNPKVGMVNNLSPSVANVAMMNNLSPILANVPLDSPPTGQASNCREPVSQHWESTPPPPPCDIDLGGETWTTGRMN